MDDLGKDIAPKDSMININTGLNYDRCLMMMQSNTSLLIARRNQVISQYDYKIIASRTYPYLNLSRVTITTYNDFETGNLKSQQTDGMNYGLTLGINLFDGFNRRREKAMHGSRLKTGTEYQQVDQQVKADLITIYYAYQNNLFA